jgi:hypothetical protein
MYDGLIFLTMLDVEYDRLFVFQVEDKTKDEVVSMLLSMKAMLFYFKKFAQLFWTPVLYFLCF